MIKKLKDAGVYTYVVGIPGSAPYEAYLNQFAQAGGKTQQYYKVTDVTQLADTFHSITIDLVTTCELATATAPQDPDNIAVLKDCNALPAGSYHYDESKQSIIIDGDECDKIRNNGAKQLDYVFGCTPVA